jgi:DNA-binding MarR family transcriptional regulator
MASPTAGATCRSAATRKPQAPPPADLLHLDRQLCFALHATSLAMTKAYKPLLSPLGLTYPQYLVMLLLWEHDDRTVNELGHLLHLDSGTLTPLLKRMQSNELLTRHRDPVDERRVRLQLTSRGRSLKQEAASIPSSMACQLDMSEPEMEALRAQLHGLRARISKIGEAG